MQDKLSSAHPKQSPCSQCGVKRQSLGEYRNLALALWPSGTTRWDAYHRLHIQPGGGGTHWSTRLTFTLDRFPPSMWLLRGLLCHQHRSRNMRPRPGPWAAWMRAEHRDSFLRMQQYTGGEHRADTMWVW